MEKPNVKNIIITVLSLVIIALFLLAPNINITGNATAGDECDNPEETTCDGDTFLICVGEKYISLGQVDGECGYEEVGRSSSGSSNISNSEDSNSLFWVFLIVIILVVLGAVGFIIYMIIKKSNQERNKLDKSQLPPGTPGSKPLMSAQKPGAQLPPYGYRPTQTPTRMAPARMASPKIAPVTSRTPPTRTPPTRTPPTRHQQEHHQQEHHQQEHHQQEHHQQEHHQQEHHQQEHHQQTNLLLQNQV